jgi:integrase
MSDQARGYLGARSNPNDRAFVGLKYNSYMNEELSKWIMKAAITKDITFHCARHTFAVLQLTLGTYINTLSKLPVHSELNYLYRRA